MSRHRISGICLCILIICFAAFRSATISAIDHSQPSEVGPDGIIFIVIAIDTEPARFSPWDASPILDFRHYADFGPDANVAAVMDSAWRQGYRDSRGAIPRFTWFVMSHEAFFHVDSCDCAIVFDSLMKFERQIKDFGDEVGWHYHHADWTDPDHDSTYSWNQLITFSNSRYSHGTDIEISERALGCLIAKTGILPTAFRSGWTWENNRFSKWLDDIFPYDYSANPGNAEPLCRAEPYRNMYDWERVPASYAGYHPDPFDYQRADGMRRWVFASIASDSRRDWNRIFLAAKDGVPQVFCLTTHSYDNIRKIVDDVLPASLRAADSAGIPVLFATASEAGSARAHISGNQQPRISMELQDSTIRIATDSAIFQRYPYCTLCSDGKSHRRVIPIQDAANCWHINLPSVRQARITCAVSTLSGKSAVATVAIP